MWSIANMWDPVLTPNKPKRQVPLKNSWHLVREPSTRWGRQQLANVGRSKLINNDKNKWDWNWYIRSPEIEMRVHRKYQFIQIQYNHVYKLIYTFIWNWYIRSPLLSCSITPFTIFQGLQANTTTNLYELQKVVLGHPVRYVHKWRQNESFLHQSMCSPDMRRGGPVCLGLLAVKKSTCVSHAVEWLKMKGQCQ